MGITAASVEANGWVLRVTLTGSIGSFASYTLDPDGSPRVVLAASHAGFFKSAGTAVAGMLARSLVATKPLRLAVNPASPTAKVIDETDLGGGSIRVRLALSEHIYASDSGLALAVLAGWRAGESAASGISVTNNSAAVAPIPIMRWALAPYDVTSGSFRLSLFVASHHPLGFDPVAGVKFTATDGTTTKTVWATALNTDNSLGDNLRCYSVTIDPTTATALTAGLLRCDAEVYPWLGSMRATDTAGTKSMVSLRTDGFLVGAASPWVIGYDPAGTRYGAQWTYVDPVNGTVTASAAMVATTLAGAKAVAAASRPKDINTAQQAGYLANRTLAAGNGQAAQTRSIDGMKIVLAPGIHSGSGSTSVTTGVAAAEIPVVIMGDPDDTAPRANCIWQTGASGIQRPTRYRMQGLACEVGGTSYGGPPYVFFDNVAIKAKAGSEANTTAMFTASPPGGQWNIAVTRSRYWRHGSTFSGGNSRLGLFRANEHSRTVQALCTLKNRFIGSSEDGYTPVNAQAYTGWPSPIELGQAEDIIIGFNDLRFLGARVFSASSISAAVAGTPNPSIRRLVLIGNICERIGADPQPFYSLGEDTSATMSYNIIEANSFVGERANTLYSDPLPSIVADTNTQLNQAYINRVAGNFFDWLPTKHDDFSDPTTLAVRSAGGVSSPTGYRPQMIEAWSMLYGVGHEGNYDAGRTGAGNFRLESMGLRSAQTTTGVPGFANDKSLLSGGTVTGGGDYRPAANSPLTARPLRGNSDRDFAGEARLLPATAGALQAMPSQLAPATAASATRCAVVSLGLALPLAAAGSGHSQQAGQARVGWAADVTPALARHDHLARILTLGWAGGLVPASGIMDNSAGAALAGWNTVLAARDARMLSVALGCNLEVGSALAPVSVRMTITSGDSLVTAFSGLVLIPGSPRCNLISAGALVLPQSDVVTTLLVAADMRTVLVKKP